MWRYCSCILWLDGWQLQVEKSRMRRAFCSGVRGLGQTIIFCNVPNGEQSVPSLWRLTRTKRTWICKPLFFTLRHTPGLGASWRVYRPLMYAFLPAYSVLIMNSVALLICRVVNLCSNHGQRMEALRFWSAIQSLDDSRDVGQADAAKKYNLSQNARDQERSMYDELGCDATAGVSRVQGAVHNRAVTAIDDSLVNVAQGDSMDGPKDRVSRL